MFATVKKHNTYVIKMRIEQFFTSNKNSNSKVFSETEKIEKPLRSVVKSITYRIIGTLATILISWLITGEIFIALTIGSIEMVAKMLLYFLHERVWNTIKWGKL